MKVLYKFNKWEYEIVLNKWGYGYTIMIYKNDIEVYQLSGFGSEGVALSYITKYIIENEHSIEL